MFDSSNLYNDMAKDLITPRDLENNGILRLAQRPSKKSEAVTYFSNLVIEYGVMYDRRRVLWMDEAIMESKDLVPEMIHKTCLDAMREKFPPSIVSLGEKMGFNKREDGVLITNESGWCGASAIIYPEIANYVSDVMNGDYYLVPTSIHEFIAISSEAYNSIPLSGNTVRKILTDCNIQNIKNDSFLSSNVYMYDSNEGLFLCPEKSNIKIEKIEDYTGVNENKMEETISAKELAKMEALNKHTVQDNRTLQFQ